MPVQRRLSTFGPVGGEDPANSLSQRTGWSASQRARADADALVASQAPYLSCVSQAANVHAGRCDERD